MEPGIAGGEAVLAALDGLGQLADVNVIEVGAGGHARVRQVRVKGSETWKVVLPGSESTLSEPSWRSTTIIRAVARPSPVPSPMRFVVKNESNTLSRMSSGMPGPSSLMS